MTERASHQGPERLLVELLERWATPALFFRADGELSHANAAAAELFGAELERGHQDRLFEPSGSADEVVPRPSVLARRPFQRLVLDPLAHGVAGWIAFCSTSEAHREQQVMEALAGLAGGVAHDFNNHLTAILSHAELALAGLGDGTARAHLEELEGAALRARLLTQQLLAFSRRGIPPADEPCPIESEPAPEPRAERAPHEQVLWLVEDDDAVRNGVRTVLERAGYRVLAAESAQQALELAPSAPQVDLLIADVRLPGMNGVELYRRLAAQRPGLRVLFMSGLVEDDSVRERLANPGIAFLQKPFTTQELLARVRSVLAAAAPRSGARLLVVDDEPGVLALIPRMLAGEPYHCTAVAGVALALQELEARAFDLVLCDLVMPERDGLELLRTISGRFPDTHVVAMTGHKLGGPGLAAARELGAVHALKKPFSRDELIFALSQACATHAA